MLRRWLGSGIEALDASILFSVFWHVQEVRVFVFCLAERGEMAVLLAGWL